MDSILISVIIPIYNVEKYLPGCLDSVLTQGVERMEAICVDDGSTDRSPQILAEYASRDARLRALRQANGGLSAARNTGIEAARGKYLLFLDSDDQLASPDVLQTLCARAEEDELELLFFEARIAYESEELRRTATESPDFYRRKCTYPRCTDGQSLYLSLERNGEYRPNAYLYLLRRSLLERSGLRFPPGIHHEDEVFTLSALGLAKRASCTPLCGYVRLWREGSIMTERSRVSRIRGNLLAGRALLEFAPERLRDAKPAFLRRYRAHARAINLRGCRQYEALSPEEREAFWQAIAEAERPILRAQLRAGKFTRIARDLRRALKRILPEPLVQRLRQALR